MITTVSVSKLKTPKTSTSSTTSSSKLKNTLSLHSLQPKSQSPETYLLVLVTDHIKKPTELTKSVSSICTLHSTQQPTESKYTTTTELDQQDLELVSHIFHAENRLQLSTRPKDTTETPSVMHSLASNITKLAADANGLELSLPSDASEDY